jgi:hypothetical protein
MNSVQYFFVRKRIISVVKRVEFFSDSMSYIRVIPRGRWRDIIILNVHAPTEDKIDDMKDSLYLELERYSINFLNTYENFVKRFQYQSNIATSKNLIVKSTMFPHHNWICFRNVVFSSS